VGGFGGNPGPTSPDAAHQRDGLPKQPIGALMVPMVLERTGSRQHRGSRRSAPARAVLVAAALLVAVGCGDDDSGEEATPGTTAAPSDDYGGAGGGSDGEAGTIVAADFELSSTTVGAGEEVTFRNDDGTAHTVTADDAAFDTGPVAAGESATFTAPATPGEVAFHCEIHPSMTGTLTVEG